MSWKVKASSSSGEDFELPPSGSYPAVMIGLIDLGTHDREYNGKTDEVHKLLLVWELVDEAKENGDNFVVIKDFTFSLHKKAKLRPFLEGWVGRTIPDDQELDLSKFLGRTCMLSISEGVSGNGKKFVDVAGCQPPPKGYKVSDASYDTVNFEFELMDSQQDSPGIPDWVPPLYGRGINDEIKKSKEWSKLPLIPSTKSAPAPAPVKQSNGQSKPSRQPQTKQAVVEELAHQFEPADTSDDPPF